ncbi:Type 1 glutamine amidotransferase-like domain-containing protein [Ornithinibacillus massiliensis]|uniref:Type 1 glutamine amidotransferase-like domain-containing protein n=1 Tax=Ornithinibacillus massiliensis TaxID=1944633 RepID=A0ABS5MFN7_9BACI|nr:Type 1 glutamine amidotransferase-like domain-containing protein [Ornithinibacillus massiliensis]MBS3681120.1 Type 1 glutamine amidotransferase-like domain-containing protein [Ornithinibacillus massiliensis]
MAKIFLTSNGFFTDTIKNEFLTIIKEQLLNPKAVIITTASPHKETNKYAIKAKNDFIKMGIKQVEFLDIEFDEPNKLKQYNIIYINGGNPFKLLYHMKKSGADSILKELVKQPTIFVGVSAGAVILGPNIEVVNYFTPEMNVFELNDLTALTITEKAIFPHYDSEDIFANPSGKSIEERLTEFERQKNMSVTRLREDQILLIDI